MEISPLVSVIIPTHNRSELLLKAITSVLKQTYQHFEIIVIDDASRDNTFELLTEYVKLNPKMRYERQEKSLGGGGARNKGLELAKGSYVAYLDDDDEWNPVKLEKQVELAFKYPEASAYSCGWEITGTKIQRPAVIPKEVHSVESLFLQNSLGGASMIFCRTDILKQIGGFDPTIRSCQDWDVWVRLALKGPIKVVSLPLVTYRFHSNQITGNPYSGYYGHRRFYFKFVSFIPKDARKKLLLFLMYQRNRTPLGNFKKKCFWLYLAWRYLPYRMSLSLTRLSVVSHFNSL